MLATLTHCLNWSWLLKFSERSLFSDTFTSSIKAIIKWCLRHAANYVSESPHNIRNLSVGFHWLFNLGAKWFQVIYNTFEPSLKVWCTFKSLSLNYESISKNFKKGFLIKMNKTSSKNSFLLLCYHSCSTYSKLKILIFTQIFECDFDNVMESLFVV